MRTVELIQIAATLLAAVAAVFRIGLRRVETSLRRRGATSGDRAMTLATDRPTVRFAVRRLAAAGAIRTAPDGRYYVDEAGWQRWRERRRRRALTAVTVILVLFGILWAAGVFR
jgi:hypothetical protein